MHMTSDAAARDLLQRMPALYNWTACRLTRNLMEECWSDDMQKALMRLAKNHMEGSKKYQVTCETPGGYILTLRKHTDPPPGFSDLRDFLKRFNKGTWFTDDDKPTKDVEIHACLSIPGDSPWELNQAKLAIESPPASIVTRFVSGQGSLSEVIERPWMKGFSIHSVWWRGEHWKNGEKISHNPPAEMNTKLEIMLEGANDFQKIRIRP